MFVVIEVALVHLGGVLFLTFVYIYIYKADVQLLITGFCVVQKISTAFAPSCSAGIVCWELSSVAACNMC